MFIKMMNGMAVMYMFEKSQKRNELKIQFNSICIFYKEKSQKQNKISKSLVSGLFHIKIYINVMPLIIFLNIFYLGNERYLL